MTVDHRSLADRALVRTLTHAEVGSGDISNDQPDVPGTIDALRAELRCLRASLQTAPLEGRRSERWCRVLRFALLMDKKLGDNTSKGDWRPAGPAGARWFVARLKAELYELEAELQGNPFRSDYDREAIALECADIANFALMIADVFGGLGDVQ